MRRVASHYIYWRRLYRMHYIELDDQGVFAGIFPLEQEIAGTEFYDGILIPVAGSSEFLHCNAIQIPPLCNSNSTAVEAVLHKLEELCVSGGVEPGKPVRLLLLSGISLTASEFGANDGCCNGHIQRL